MIALIQSCSPGAQPCKENNMGEYKSFLRDPTCVLIHVYALVYHKRDGIIIFFFGGGGGGGGGSPRSCTLHHRDSMETRSVLESRAILQLHLDFRRSVHMHVAFFRSHFHLTTMTGYHIAAIFDAPKKLFTAS